MDLPDHKTKIVCTIGPASDSPDILARMMRAGMDVARLNFSHGDLEGHRRVIRSLRRTAEEVGRRVAILADLPGPKIRIGDLASEPVRLEPGRSISLTTEPIVGDETRVSVSLERLPDAVKPGDALYLDDGNLQLAVEEASGSEVRCRVVVGGPLRSRKGLNLPGIDLGIGAFTERDREFLAFAAREGIDAVSQSFVESENDLAEVRRAADDLDYDPFLIAKIERASALGRIDEILDASDGIMIARGDLGVEVPIERIAVIQKELVRKALRKGKPVITATQMLESMTRSRRPTRAESTDVANSILDGTDCVMLSGESAMGRYPVEAVAMLARIAAATEAARPRFRVRDLFGDGVLPARLEPTQLIAAGVEASLDFASPAAIFVPTRSGTTARRLARFRFPVWIVAPSPREATCRELTFSAGVHPVMEEGRPADWTPWVRQWVESRGLDGRLAILTEGPSAERPDANHRMEIVEIDRGEARTAGAPDEAATGTART
jgi:pyruvate kinase